MRTVCCLGVVLAGLFAVGVPVSWLLGGRKPLDESGWVKAPFLGLAVVVLLLQNLIYLDVRLVWSTPLLWGLVLLLWAWMGCRRQLRESLASCPRGLLAAALAVYAVHGLGLLLLGVSTYVGRGWSDQFSYVAVAQFFIDHRFNTPLTAIGNQPALVAPLHVSGVGGYALISERIGSFVLLGFFALTGGGDARLLFEPTILLSPLLIVLAVYALCRRLSLPPGRSLLTSVAAGLLPGVASIHLESFLSHAHAVPLLLLFPAMLDELNERPRRGTLVAAALLMAVTASVYSEFWPILVGVTVLVLGLNIGSRRQGWRVLGRCAVLVAAPFVLNPLYAPRMFGTFQRLDITNLGFLYPWAFRVEGLARIWLGDLAALPLGPARDWLGNRASAPASLAQVLVRACGLLTTALAYFGLASACKARLAACVRAAADPTARRSFALVAGLFAVALLPILVACLDHEHGYQFYKLLLSVSPLLAVGVCLAFAAAPGPSWNGEVFFCWRNGARLAPLVGTVVLGAVLLSGAAGTGFMAVTSASASFKERSYGPLLHDPDLCALERQLSTLSGKNLLLWHSDESWSTGLTNAWLSWSARKNRVWLGNPKVNDLSLDTIEEARQITNLSGLPENLLVLTGKGCEMARDQFPGAAVLWANPSYQLLQPRADMPMILHLETPYGIEQFAGRPFFWMGQGDTMITVHSSRAEVMELVAQFVLGPSLPGTDPRQVRVQTDMGYQETVMVGSGEQALAVPLGRGTTRIVLTALDRPVVSPLPGGDPRTLLLGVGGLYVRSKTLSVVDGQVSSSRP
jgi:hypothetical protein